jgi:hypothetical protein
VRGDVVFRVYGVHVWDAIVVEVFRRDAGSLTRVAGYERNYSMLRTFEPFRHDGSTIPGSEHWNADKEWPVGGFGFVWGCIWGDDSSWKAQHLDLRRVQEGVIARDERFGYVRLATDASTPPGRSPDDGDPFG